MRVLFVWHAAVVSTYRERFRALRRVAPDIELIVLVPDGSFEGGQWVSYQSHPADDYRIVQPGSIWTTHPNALFYRMTLGQLRRLQPDIVHVHEESWMLASVQMLLAFWKKAPIIVESWENLMRPLKWPFRVLEPWLMERASAFVAGTPGVERVLRSKGAVQPIAVIPYGTVLPSGSAQGRQVNSPVRIGYVGRMTQEKGILTLLGAAKMLSVPFEMVFIGNGPLADQVQATHLTSDYGKIRWVSNLPPDEILEEFKSLDILVLPSLTTPSWAEQFGRVLIEAMSVGTVPIGSSSGEIPWVIGDAGLVFPEGDSHALAKTLEGLIRDPREWAVLSHKARARFESAFRWETVGRQLEVFYRSISLWKGDAMVENRRQAT